MINHNNNRETVVSETNKKGWLTAVVISKNFNKVGSRHNHAHSLGVAQLQSRPYIFKDGNMII